jgi:4-oxalocrotonate tautomerase
MARRSSGWNTSPTSNAGDGDTMPHVIVKLWPGKSEQQKRRLAEAITDDVMKVVHYGEESVSVAFEEVDANNWAEKVYQPDIVRKADTLYKKPGYTM